MLRLRPRSQPPWPVSSKDNLSNVKSVGAGVYECRIDFGPGYRAYLGRDGESLVVLLGGGTKKRQDKDIQDAHEYWKDYKWRKARGE